MSKWESGASLSWFAESGGQGRGSRDTDNLVTDEETWLVAARFFLE